MFRVSALTFVFFLHGASAFTSAPRLVARRAVSSSYQRASTGQAVPSLLGPRASTKLSAATAVAAKEKPEWMPTETEKKKLLPLGLMFFCILFRQDRMSPFLFWLMSPELSQRQRNKAEPLYHLCSFLLLRKRLIICRLTLLHHFSQLHDFTRHKRRSCCHCSWIRS